MRTQRHEDRDEKKSVGVTDIEGDSESNRKRNAVTFRGTIIVAVTIRNETSSKGYDEGRSKSNSDGKGKSDSSRHIKRYGDSKSDS